MRQTKAVEPVGPSEEDEAEWVEEEATTGEGEATDGMSSESDDDDVPLATRARKGVTTSPAPASSVRIIVI